MRGENGERTGRQRKTEETRGLEGGGGGGGGPKKNIFLSLSSRPLPSRARVVYFFASVDSLYFPRINGPNISFDAYIVRHGDIIN